MSHHLHLMVMVAQGISFVTPRMRAIDEATRRIIPRGIIRHPARDQLAIALASVLANEIRAEFARVVGGKP